jgi:hypothetical protein
MTSAVTEHSRLDKPSKDDHEQGCLECFYVSPVLFMRQHITLNYSKAHMRFASLHHSHRLKISGMIFNQS